MLLTLNRTMCSWFSSGIAPEILSHRLPKFAHWALTVYFCIVEFGDVSRDENRGLGDSLRKMGFIDLRMSALGLGLGANPPFFSLGMLWGFSWFYSIRAFRKEWAGLLDSIRLPFMFEGT